MPVAQSFKQQLLKFDVGVSMFHSQLFDVYKITARGQFI
jgi:hypothetical protein